MNFEKISYRIPIVNYFVIQTRRDDNLITLYWLRIMSEYKSRTIPIRINPYTIVLINEIIIRFVTPNWSILDFPYCDAFISRFDHAKF